MQLSLHFRGPLYLKQFGVYYPKTKSKRHIHQHLGRRHHAHHKKAVDDCDEDSSSPGADNSNSGTWEQSAYYNADQQFANGLVFLNNNGGDGSGTFDLYVISSGFCLPGANRFILIAAVVHLSRT